MITETWARYQITRQRRDTTRRGHYRSNAPVLTASSTAMSTRCCAHAFFPGAPISRELKSGFSAGPPLLLLPPRQAGFAAALVTSALIQYCNRPIRSPHACAECAPPELLHRDILCLGRCGRTCEPTPKRALDRMELTCAVFARIQRCRVQQNKSSMRTSPAWASSIVSTLLETPSLTPCLLAWHAAFTRPV